MLWRRSPFLFLFFCFVFVVANLGSPHQHGTILVKLWNIRHIEKSLGLGKKNNLQTNNNNNKEKRKKRKKEKKKKKKRKKKKRKKKEERNQKQTIKTTLRNFNTNIPLAK